MALDVIALAAFSAPSFREALARAARYKPCAAWGRESATLQFAFRSRALQRS